jgi:periplasmic mercuric ion binding protein
MKKVTLITALLAFGLISAYAQFGDQLTSTTSLEDVDITLDKKDVKTVTLKITGMTCGGCANHVTTALKETEGVVKVNLKYPGDLAIVDYDSAKTNEKVLITVVEKANYKAEIVKK